MPRTQHGQLLGWRDRELHTVIGQVLTSEVVDESPVRVSQWEKRIERVVLPISWVMVIRPPIE